MRPCEGKEILFCLLHHIVLQVPELWLFSALWEYSAEHIEIYEYVMNIWISSADSLVSIHVPLFEQWPRIKDTGVTHTFQVLVYPILTHPRSMEHSKL